MPTYETTKFLSLPQQVNKNKKDIETLQQNQADISNLIPNTEKGQPLGVATLDINGLVPPAQLPPNPGNFLEKNGGTMEGSINMDGYDLTNVSAIQSSFAFIEEIDSINGETQVQVPFRMNNNKITGADKGTANGDVATVDNINDHNTSPFAHADIRNLISAIQGAYIYRGVINENTVDVTQINLNARILAIMGRAAILGDVLTDLDRTDWYFDGTSWDNMGQTFVVLASAVNDGLMSKEDYTKLFDLYTKAQLDALLLLKSDLTYVNTQLSLKANIAQEAWITPTLLNSWVHYFAGGIKYYKNTIGEIKIKGRTNGGVIGNTIFTLPANYRPSETLIFSIICFNNVIATLTIENNGDIKFTGGNNTWVSLSGITFKAEA